MRRFGNHEKVALRRIWYYTDIHNLRPTQGWSADAMKNGRMVHVILGENGLVSTFRGE